MDLPNLKMVVFHSYVNVYQRVGYGDNNGDFIFNHSYHYGKKMVCKDVGYRLV